jgi:hypothetical protein
MITFDTTKLKDALGFTLKLSAWGNRRRADMSKVDTNSDKSRLKLSKELISAAEYDDIKSFMGELRGWVAQRTVPSFFREGFQLASTKAVEEIEGRMRKARTEELPALVEKLVAVYPQKIDEARVALNGQFNERDYPSSDELRALFSVDWNWISFSTPEGLPEELKQAEREKLQKQMSDAGEQITLALRVGFQELIAHAVDRLQPADADGKKRVFRDSLIERVQEFIDCFQSRNLLGDKELESLVNKAQEIIIGVNPDDLRKNDDLRETTRQQFDEIKKELDVAVDVVKNRKFNWDA